MSLQFNATPEELGVFLEEAEEQLQLLDQDILVLEKEGANPDLLQEVFRAAHTLKGSSAAIGHERMASLTHIMESILDCLRKGQLDTSTTMIDLLLQSLDVLRILKEEVITLEDSGIDPSSLVVAMRRFLAENMASSPILQPAAPPIPTANSPQPLLDSETAQLLDEWADEGDIYEILVTIAEDSPFPAARCLQVHIALSEMGSVIASNPSLQEIEAEQVDSYLQLLYCTKDPPQSIEEALQIIPDITSIRIEEPKAGAEVLASALIGNNENAPAAAARQPTFIFPGDNGGNRGGPIIERKGTSRNGNAVSKTIRMDVERLDALMNLVGELVISCTRMVQVGSRLQARFEGEELVQEVGETSLALQRITDELQDRIMKARMFPIASVFNRFPRMIRDLSQKAGKKIEFIMEGEETEIDRSVIEAIGDPLIHLLRNSVDHGIETPEQRVAAGKPETGLIRLSACHRESRIILTVEDDGQGIDPRKVRAAAVARGLLTPEGAERLSDREAIELVFAPGFSTVEKVSDVSGRGVGMDVVKTNIHKLNGQVSIDSTPGKGTRIDVELPLTLAIMDALLIGLGQNTFAIPLSSVVETLRVSQEQLSSVNGGKVIQLRGHVLPLLFLDEMLGCGTNTRKAERVYVVVVGANEEQVGIIVDGLIGEQQVVVKALGTYIGDVPGVSGATILGDGRVALILDVPALVRETIQERGRELMYA